jgi:nucleotide-binding universal stress UspA family protein
VFENVVVALDGSESSDGAFAYASQLAKEHGSKVHVVHVVEIFVGRGGGGPVHVDESDLQTKVRGQLEELRSAGVDADIDVEAVVSGGPAHVIATVAERVKADTIVAGTRGHTALAGVFVGSVAHRLLHLAHCPVLIIPQSAG